MSNPIMVGITNTIASMIKSSLVGEAAQLPKQGKSIRRAMIAMPIIAPMPKGIHLLIFINNLFEE